MTEKTFQITASGHAFNLETFVTEKTVLHQGRPTITFESKNEFDQRLDSVLKRFFMAIESVTDNVEFVVTYKSGKLDAIFDVTQINKYARTDDRLDLIAKITELVQRVERQIKETKVRIERNM